MLFDYETLKIIWWLLVGALLIGFAIMDGHDMGVCTLLPFVGKNDDERRVIVNTVGPHWEGNQVWFITAGGALFAAWPMVYALAFSGFYWAMMAVLWALFFRPVGFKYRSMVKDQRWRNAWDWGLFVGSFVPAVVFGVAFGNLFLGVPFSFDNMMRSTYTGSFWNLLNPFSILCGLVSATMLIMQGGAFLAHRTEGDIQARTTKYTMISAVAMVVLFVAAGVWIQSIDGYAIVSNSIIIAVDLREFIKTELKIEADDNLQDIISFDLYNNTLRIFTTKKATNYKKLIVKITYTDNLNAITSKNESTVNAIQELLLNTITLKPQDASKLFINANTKNFILQAEDKSKTELNLKSENTAIELNKNSSLKALVNTVALKVDQYQKSNATLEGNATSTNIRLDNNAMFTGNKLNTISATITTESYTNCSLFVEKEVTIDAANKSEIQLLGTPKIEMRKFMDEARLIKKLK